MCLSGLPQGLGWISGRPHGQIRPSCGPTARAMMLVDRSEEKKWCHRASMRSTSCSGKTTVPSGSTSNSGACANRASSGQLEDARHPCIMHGQWGGMPRPWRPTAGSCRRRQARAMKGIRTTLNAASKLNFGHSAAAYPALSRVDIRGHSAAAKVTLAAEAQPAKLRKVGGYHLSANDEHAAVLTPPKLRNIGGRRSGRQNSAQISGFARGSSERV